MADHDSDDRKPTIFSEWGKLTIQISGQAFAASATAAVSLFVSALTGAFVLNKSNWFTAVIIVSVFAVSGIGLIAWNVSAMFPRRRRLIFWPFAWRRFVPLESQVDKQSIVQKSDIVSENLLAGAKQQLIPALFLLLPIAVLLIVNGDTYAAAFAFAVIAILSIHWAVTSFRVRNGLLGSNSSEAAEIIDFMIQKTKHDGAPPGSKVSNPTKQSRESGAAAALQGARV